MARELIGARVELAVGELAVLEDDGHGIGRAGDLCLDQLRHRPLQIDVDRVRVPLGEHLTRLFGREQGNGGPLDRCIRRDDDGELARHRGDLCIGEDAGVVDPAALSVASDHERKVALRRKSISE